MRTATQKATTRTHAFQLFLARAHQLLHLAYESMQPSLYNTWQEPEISGEIADRIEAVLVKRSKPWMRYWTAMDNPPENQRYLPISKRLLGKCRKIPDIKLKYAGHRETLYFRYEAKRLADSGSYADLIGHESGLGRFLRREYGRHDAAGGLLGYVQTETPEIHADRVQKAFAKEPKRYRLRPDGLWLAIQWDQGPKYCFRTVHSRQHSSQTIEMFCSFLSFL